MSARAHHTIIWTVVGIILLVAGWVLVKANVGIVS